MATVRLYLAPEEAQYLATTFPQFVRNLGTNFPVSGLAYDGAGTTAERAYFKFEPAGYASGIVTVDIIWYADTASSSAVVWEAALAAITPDVDTQDVETDALATAVTVTDTHLGTTGQRLHRATIALSGASLDSIAAGDECWLRISRLPGNAADTMNTSDAIVTSVRVSFSDT